MTAQPQQLWQEACALLREDVGTDSFESWLKPLSLSPESSVTKALIEVPTKFLRDWVIRHYSDNIATALATASGQDVAMEFVLKPLASASKLQDFATPQTLPVASKPTPVAAPVVAQTPLASTPANLGSLNTEGLRGDDGTPYVQSKAIEGGPLLNPNFTFDSFVVGKSNQFAYAAAQRIADSGDATLYNPFFLHGGVGLGKTHLMHAIAWCIHELHPEMKVLYMSSEKFLYKFIRALQDKTTASFKETFRSVDVLMIDDVQFIAGKEATQEEFFHTFNALIEMQKRIILSADRSPHDMVNIEDRLRSRLGCGLTTEIHLPDLETRVAILERKAEARNLPLGKDVAMLLADKVTSNIRELEGALNRLFAHAELVNTPITVELTKELLKDLFKNFDRVISLDDIQKKVADFYHIKLTDMSAARRSRDVARPRQIAMYLCKTLTSKSYPEIGKAFGGRDHTTVMHAVRQVESLKANDPGIADDLRLLESMLGQ